MQCYLQSQPVSAQKQAIFLVQLPRFRPGQERFEVVGGPSLCNPCMSLSLLRTRAKEHRASVCEANEPGYPEQTSSN